MVFEYNDALEASIEYFDGDEMAANIFLSKYALRSSTGELLEKTPDDMHKRLAKEFARIECKYPNPLSEQEIYEYLKDYSKIVPQGSPMAGIGNPHQITSISNCFVIQSPHDSYGGILKTDQEQAQIMKRRGGVGFDISTIRPKGLPTANAAQTTDGIAIFMERFSNTCREVAQGGRRGALMLSISVHHPEIRTFIHIKEDLKKVTGANISIRISDEFMEAVKSGNKVQLRFPVDQKEQPLVEQWVNASELWDEIISAAHKSAEPGLLFWDTIMKYCPANSYPQFQTKSVNPCFSGDTYINTATERGSVTIKELAEEGVDVPVLSVNPKNRKLEIKMGRNPRVTGYDKELVRLFLRNDSYFDLTPDHKCMLLDGSPVLAKDLKAGDKLPKSVNGLGDLFTEVEKVTPLPGKHTVYNITVDDNHTVSISPPNDPNYVGIHVYQCGEINLSEYDSCRLLLVNTLSFVQNQFTENASFDFESFARAARVGQRLMDDIVDLELECIDRILSKIEADPEPEDVKVVEKGLWNKIREACVTGRRTGLGVTAIGDMVAAMNRRYGSDESIKLVEDVYRTLCLNSYRESISLAKERGTFPAFSFELERDDLFLNRLWGSDPTLHEEYLKWGRRNIANLTTAPAGTVSTQTQTTSGIENTPYIIYTRRKKKNPNDLNFRCDFVDELGDQWQEFKVYHHGFTKWKEVTGKSDSDIEQSPYWGSTINDVDWVAKVKMQAAAQKWLDHSISNTTNLPNDVSVETVKSVYMTGWELGCKGVTVYRDGSRSGVLVADTPKEPTATLFSENHAPKRPQELVCDVYHNVVQGDKWIIFVGLLDGKPYEVMGGLAKHIKLPKRVKSGKIIKVSTGGTAQYNFHYDYESPDSETVIEDIGNIFENKVNAAFTRTISLSLRHGSPIQYVVDQLLKGSDKDSDMFSFAKVISRVLKNYIKEGLKVSGKKCESCQSTNLVYQQGCVACLDCGFSKCG